MTKSFTTGRIAVMGMLAALSVVLVWLVRVPMFLPFLEYDPADIPILVGTLFLGPTAGLALTVVASTVQGLTVSSGSGFIGIFMHIVATGAMVLVVGVMRRNRRSVSRTIFSLVCGALAMTVTMIPLNLIITPLFMGRAIEEVLGLLLPAIIPFNLVKAGINCGVTALIYATLHRVIKVNA